MAITHRHIDFHILAPVYLGAHLQGMDIPDGFDS